MSKTHTDAEKWNHGNGISITHRRLCYHFQILQGGYVELSCVDELDSDKSYRDQQVPRVPKAVHKRLSAEGYTVIA